MNKIVVIIASVILVISGLMSFLRNIMSTPCDLTKATYKSCVMYGKFKSDGTEDPDSHKSYKDMHIVRLIHAVVMVVLGVLLFLAKSKMQ